MCDDAGTDEAQGICEGYLQTPAAGEQVANWDPRTCITDSDVEAVLPKVIASGVLTWGTEGVDSENTWADDLEGCVYPALEEEGEEEVLEDEEEEAASVPTFVLATLAATAAYMA